ncbi:hypothetical protein GGTG_11594 [Gaeumannomyces tritici R3-111a-1]|uniref:Uncharacterized protein n=1 Tax=Gaeumannomyces tritici (strain R3-111a-1) TaxID=644352 RepID=J3PDM1_GAET3|nr:hypothetical protein GGTG_11594 [Gaeumannomyces tritici R3-111a-1]EJT70571.1 hypothetical protein GGTG_11594 [Gaeumannomyces tritici R3-111a-1]
MYVNPPVSSVATAAAAGQTGQASQPLHLPAKGSTPKTRSTVNMSVDDVFVPPPAQQVPST